MGITGKAGMGVVQNEADLVQASLLKSDYEHHSIVAGAPLVDATLVSLSATAFGTVVRAHTVIIRTNADISFKFNSVANHEIPLSTGESSFVTNTLEVSQIYFTAPIGAAIKVFLV